MNPFLLIISCFYLNPNRTSALLWSFCLRTSCRRTSRPSFSAPLFSSPLRSVIRNPYALTMNCHTVHDSYRSRGFTSWPLPSKGLISLTNRRHKPHARMFRSVILSDGSAEPGPCHHKGGVGRKSRKSIGHRVRAMPSSGESGSS